MKDIVLFNLRDKSNALILCSDPEFHSSIYGLDARTVKSSRLALALVALTPSTTKTDHLIHEAATIGALVYTL